MYPMVTPIAILHSEAVAVDGASAMRLLVQRPISQHRGPRPEPERSGHETITTVSRDGGKAL